jgi:GNAT superfamily N-acetyltransferase
MEAKLSFVPYSERYSEAHRVFALKNWKGKRRRYEESYIRWKFRGPMQGEMESCLLALENEAVVGQVGLIPVDIRIGEQSLKAQWVCDLMVDRAAQGKWIGSKILKAAIARNQVSLGSDPSKAADVVMSRIGFRPIKGPKKLIMPVKLNHLLSWRIPEKFKFAIPLLAQLCRPIIFWRSRGLRWHRGQNGVKRLPWQEVAPLIEQHQKKSTSPHVVHDFDFLQWRCSGLEGFAAKIYAIATNAGSYAILEEGGPYLYVQDWFVPHREDFIPLYQEILQVAIEAGSQTIQTLAQDEQETEMLLNVGFLVRRHDVKIICYPPHMLIPTWDKFLYCLYDSDGNL